MPWGALRVAPTQLLLRSGRVGPWLGQVRGGLAEPPGLAAPFGLCCSTGHLSSSAPPLTRNTFTLPCRAQQSGTRANAEGIGRGKGHPWREGGRAQTQAWQLAWARRLGGGGPAGGSLWPRLLLGCSYLHSQVALAALSGLWSFVPLHQPGSPAQLILAAATTHLALPVPSPPQIPPWAALTAAQRFPLFCGGENVAFPSHLSRVTQ